MSVSATSIDQLTINTIRTLAMDAVQAANSGHPGTPMALAPVAYTVWTQAMHFDPDAPHWPNRDRFVLSCGHASMLLYAVLHLAGVKQYDSTGKPTGELAVPLEHIKRFRQLHSRTPGHPESFETTGVETTTGPLGQGCGNSVGMAIAERWLAAHYNRPGYNVFDYRMYTVCSDGDMMEGVTAEAASLAGHLRLANLCWIYDDNSITIEGDTSLAFSEDVGTRFAGYGWNVHRIADANDLDAIGAALDAFQHAENAPTLIIVKSHIAWGAPTKQDTHGAHGSPLGEEEIRRTKAVYGWPEDAKFLVPPDAQAHFQASLAERGHDTRLKWEAMMKEYGQKFPELAHELELIEQHKLPEGWEKALPTFPPDPKGLATRVSSGKVLNAVAKQIPWLIGGSADLAPSTMTNLEGPDESSFSADNYGGRNFHFGIREHGMASSMNGIAASGVRAYGSTFLVFSDYLRPALRLAALMRRPVLHVFTHDSIGVGEDGPTHEPVEHYAALRAIPDLVVFRPGDANEVSESYRAALGQNTRPVALLLTRQNLPTLDRSKYAPAAGTLRGGYVLADCQGQPEVILIGTGSELHVCVGAYEELTKQGTKARLVSLPCWELFDEQPEDYRNQVLPPAVTARVGVESGVIQGWERYLGPQGKFVGMKGYGASAPGNELFKYFGFTVENVVAHAKAAMGK